ncbi:MAG: hypothetical protein RL301_208 [Actinomycetota bacterium]|jgi:hypothetical protein
MEPLDLEAIKAELAEIEASGVETHSERYEILHAKLVAALNSIEDI